MAEEEKMTIRTSFKEEIEKSLEGEKIETLPETLEIEDGRGLNLDRWRKKR